MKWYFTFMSKQPYLKDKYIMFEGTLAEARDKMVTNFGTLWAAQYNEAQMQLILKDFNLTELK